MVAELVERPREGVDVVLFLIEWMVSDCQSMFRPLT